jgi:hypothetical protein
MIPFTRRASSPFDFASLGDRVRGAAPTLPRNRPTLQNADSYHNNNTTMSNDRREMKWLAQHAR